MENWIKIGKNIFLNDVFENEKGIRKIYKNGNEILEKENEKNKIEFCRCVNKEYSNLLLENIYNETFLNSYQKSLNKIFITFYVRDNSTYLINSLKNSDERNQLIKSLIDKNNQLFNKYNQRVKEELFLKFVRNWKMNLNDNLSHIEWNKWMNKKNYSDYYLGIQYGLWLLLKNKKEEIVDIGLNNDLDSPLLTFHNKKIFSFYQSNYEYSPFSYQLDLKELNIILDKVNKNKQSFYNNYQLSALEESLTSDKNIKLFWDNILLKTEIKENVISYLQKSILEKQKIIFISKENNSIFNNHFLKKCQDNAIFYKKIIVRVSHIEKYELFLFSLNASKNINEIKEINFEAFCKDNNFWKKKNREIFDYIQKDKVKYQSVSNATESTAIISSKIANEVKEALLKVQQEHKNLDSWISKLLGIKKEDISNRLSGEQIDAISLAISSLMKNKGLIIADETGFGKGRILAAIAIIGLKMGKTVFFFTEKSQLFSDFYRDISAVKNEDEDFIPLILNQNGVIYNTNGELIVNKKKEREFKSLIQEKQDWDKKELPFLALTYSQINKNGTKQPKMQLLSRLQGENCWIILDEAHNASGNSNINKNLKYLIDKSEGVIFSSATYAKTEEKLSIYDKALPLSEISKTMIKFSLFGDNGDLREMLTKEMAKQGNYIRREHPPIDLPEIIYFDNEDLENKVNSFSKMWQKIFYFVELKEKMFGYFSARAWLTLGGILSRSIREFQFLCKVNNILPIIEDLILKNEKVVLVTEMTFESGLRNLIENGCFDLNNEDVDSISDNEETVSNKKHKEKVFEEKPKWCWKWIDLIETLSDEELLLKELNFRERDPNFDKDNYLKLKPVFLSYKNEVIEEILKNNYFDLSPLDDLKQKLKDKNIQCGELSGRKYQLYSKDNQWIIDNSLEKIDRNILVSKFNNGEMDCIIITGSGASGISLHAGEKFKDQRKRNLIELDISANSANRVQFLGRVRRKDQVIEPNFYTPIIKTLSDIRKMENEKRKLMKLTAHVGGRKESKILDWISDEGEMIIDEWGKENKEWAKKIGAFNVDVKNETKRIDRAMQRALILPKEEQEFLFKRLQKGIEAHQDFYFYQNQPLPESQSINAKFLWGKEKSKREELWGTDSVLNLEYITMNYRVWNFQEKKIDKNKIEKLLIETQKEIEKNKKENHIDILLSQWEEICQERENPFQFKALNEVKKLFEVLKIGSVFKLGFKNNLYDKNGVLIDVLIPNYDNNDVIDIYTSFSLNTICAKVLFEGDDFYINIPLIFLLKNKLFKVISNNFPQNLSKYLLKESNYLYSSTIEGNPILISTWNKKMKIGKIENIYDKEEGEKTILLLPKDINFSKIESLDIPFINFDQIRYYLEMNENDLSNKEKEQKYIYSHPIKEKAKIGLGSYREYGKKMIYVFFANEKEYKYYQNKWLLKASRFVKERVVNNKTIMVKFYANKLYHILSLMQDDDISFFCPNKEKQWFDEKIYKFF